VALLVVFTISAAEPAAAQSVAAATPAPDEAEPAESQVVTYEPDFFNRYDPVTALDMVRQIPGFKLESRSQFGNSPDVRGFGAAAGNILINGKRPSTKSDSMDSLLARISAGEVLRLELIRGATGASDRDITQGSVVVNIVLNERTGGRDPSPWEVALQYEDGAFSPFAEFAISTQRKKTKYLLGLERTYFDWDVRGPEQLSSATEPGERRSEIQFRDGDNLSLDLKSETQLSGEGTLRLNAKGALKTNNGLEVSDRRLETGRTDLFLRSNNSETEEFEVGGDYERNIAANMAVKLIALLSREHQDGGSGLDIARGDDSSEISLSTTLSDEGETIGRLEFDWSKWSRHAIKFGGEVAHNFVESRFDLTVDDGTGPVSIDVPGANTRVTERRGETFVSDTWPVSETITVNLGFALEVSKIEQSGDVGKSRSFTYPKPSFSITSSPSSVSQWRLRAERQVSQLNFFDFVSSSNFEDLDTDFGNPDLQPERTWHLTSTHERRFGDISVLEVGAFYDKIDDVEDLLPVGEDAEIVGNIGDGKRWGATVNLTVPLTFLGLKDSRFDLEYEAQDSSVTDPVTGEKRKLSGESDHKVEASFRKELPSLNAAIGGNFNWGSTPTVFGFDELVSERPRSHMNFHLEARVWKGFKARFEVFNVLDKPQTRRRTVFAGSRLSSGVAFEENRSRIDGQWFRLTLSGLF
jgi:outer membrane receptor protein involved in Fe transport